MRRAKLVIWSGLLNVVLLLVVVWQAHLLRQGSPAALTSATGESASQSSLPVSPGDPAASAETHRAPPSPAVDTSDRFAPSNRFASRVTARSAPVWRQVESEDYRDYVKNLRAIGCPEATVRDIVAADVLQSFAARRDEAAAGRYAGFKYWEFDDAANAAYAQQRRAVDAAMGELMRQLLGPEAAVPSSAADWKRAESSQQLAFLPADRRAAVEQVLRSYAGIDVQLPSAISGNRLTGAQAEELRLRMEAFDRMHAELTGLLSPEQYERLDMSVSWTADNLRQAMAKFHPTEAEFQEIFRAWREHDERIARLWAAGEPDPGNTQVFERIRQALGEERYALYRSTWWK